MEAAIPSSSCTTCSRSPRRRGRGRRSPGSSPSGWAGWLRASVDEWGTSWADRDEPRPRLLLLGHLDTVPGDGARAGEGRLLYGAARSTRRAARRVICAAATRQVPGTIVVAARSRRRCPRPPARTTAAHAAGGRTPSLSASPPVSGTGSATRAGPGSRRRRAPGHARSSPERRPSSRRGVLGPGPRAPGRTPRRPRDLRPRDGHADSARRAHGARGGARLTCRVPLGFDSPRSRRTWRHPARRGRAHGRAHARVRTTGATPSSERSLGHPSHEGQPSSRSRPDVGHNLVHATGGRPWPPTGRRLPPDQTDREHLDVDEFVRASACWRARSCDSPSQWRCARGLTGRRGGARVTGPPGRFPLGYWNEPNGKVRRMLVGPARLPAQRFAFDRYLHVMPNLRALMAAGTWARSRAATRPSPCPPGW